MRRDLPGAGVAAVKQIKTAKIRITRDQIITASRIAVGCHVIQISARELRMVQDIEKLGAEAELDALGDTEILAQRGVDIIGRLQRKRIASDVGKCVHCLSWQAQRC